MKKNSSKVMKKDKRNNQINYVKLNLLMILFQNCHCKTLPYYSLLWDFSYLGLSPQSLISPLTSPWEQSLTLHSEIEDYAYTYIVGDQGSKEIFLPFSFIPIYLKLGIVS